jgi:hypothetical protein
MKGNSLAGAVLLIAMLAAAAAPSAAQERRLGEAMPVVQDIDPDAVEIAARQIEMDYEDSIMIEDPMRGTVIVSKYRWKNWVARSVYLMLFNIALTIIILSLPKNEEQNLLIAYFLSGAGFTLAIWVFFCALLLVKLGSAASAHVFATLGAQHHGCELFGPQLLVDDIVTERMAIADFELRLPDGPGFGVEIDPAQLERFDRRRAGLQATHIDLGQGTAKAKA